ncbi:thioredoxin, mitochondrial [Drosophila grimshawi]|uniref:GH23019 n=1 Tax=Drosophila grimshawi TaxID=7222 RepID=B4JWD4_DROGR|nr:thioredoxin, mitochondrial [Drosophila grimshawi]EDV98272.1 GH23019 [Drosophila grimshawi]
MLRTNKAAQLKFLKNVIGSSQICRNNYRRAATGKRTIFDVENIKDFENNVKRCEKPVVVDFHASWCTPCKALAPRVASIVSEQRGGIHLARVDIDELTELALDYQVGSVPSLLVMHNGKVLNRMVGLQTSEYIREWLGRVINTCAPDCSFIKK